MVLFSPQGKIKQYHSTDEIFQDFVQTRVIFYEERKNEMLENLRRIHMKASNQARFIKECLDTDLKLHSDSQKEILETLKQRKYDLMMPQNIPEHVAEDAIVLEEDEEPEIANETDSMLSTLRQGYNYLFTMEFWMLTQEKYEQLVKEGDEAIKILEKVARIQPLEMWNADLEKLDEAYTQFENERQIRRNNNANDTAHAKSISKSKAKISKSKNPRKPPPEIKARSGELRSDVDSQADEMDPASEKKPAKGPNAKPQEMKASEERKKPK
jgi:DNA topoisomerase-2